MSEDATANLQKPRLLTDVNFNARIVVGLRRIAPTVDLITAQDAGFQRMSDPELLMKVKQLDRILLTHNINTVPDHFTTFLADLPQGEFSPGIMLVAQGMAIGVAIQTLYEIWSCSQHWEWRNLFTE